MSQCGDVKRGQDIPGKGRYAYTKYIWHACINCEARRWVVLYQGRPKHLRCGRCVEKNLREKNGIKSDNRLENLALLKADTLHNKTMNKQIKKQARQITELQTRVTLLEAENVRIEMLYQEVGIAGIITTPPG